VLRAADPDRDGAACAAIYRPFVEQSAISFEEIAPDAEQFAQRIAETSRTHPWLVLEDEGRVIAYAYGAPHRARPAYRWTAEVGIYVDLAHRRRGAGRRLYVALLERLRRQHFRVACAAITLPNDPSVALHLAVGFLPVGIQHRVGFKLSAWHDVSWWQLQLAPDDDSAPEEPVGPQALPAG